MTSLETTKIVLAEKLSTERLVLESGSIVVTLETGSGANSLPMLLIETDVDMHAHDWASNVCPFNLLMILCSYLFSSYDKNEFSAAFS